ncbi:MAG: phosphatase PAP2 family protein [Gemmatimonadota bacterium]|nr:phosphatase PAP2 family protein [Gemmatimonadota bacterium]
MAEGLKRRTAATAGGGTARQVAPGHGLAGALDPVAAPVAAARPGGGLLAGDILAAAYLAATGLLALVSAAPAGVLLAGLHAVAIAGILALSRLPAPRRAFPAFLRIAWPVAVTPLLYMELATLNQLLFPGYHDAFVQGWERALFGVQLSVAASDWFPSLWLSETLHAGYVSYYLVVPAALWSAWTAGGRDGLERAAFTTALGFFLCYLCFAVFPVAGPRYDFPKITGPPSQGAVFALVHTILESGSSKGTAFPSSHVAATLSAWLAAGAVNRRAFWLLSPFAVALTLGTVYGRFHYGVDAAAGVLFAVTAFLAAPPLIRRLGTAGAPSGA